MRHTRRIVTSLKNLIWLTLAFGFAACGHDQNGVSGGDGGADGSGNELPDSLTKRIGPAGGSLKVRGVTLTVPKDALKKPTDLTVSNLGDKAISDLPAPALGFSRASRPAAFEPHGQTFEVPVQIEMVAESNPKSVTVQRLDDPKDTSWESIAQVTDNLPQAKFGTRTFSIYSLFSGQETEVPTGSGGAQGVGGKSAAGGQGLAAGGAPSAGGAVTKGSGGAPSAGGTGGLGFGGDVSVDPEDAYFDDGTWKGYWFEIQPKAEGLETNLADLTEPFCITSGSVSDGERGGLGFNLNQDQGGEALLYTPENSEGFSFSIHNVAKGNFEFQVGLVDDAGNVYCAEVSASEREEFAVRQVYFSDLVYCSGNQSRPSSFEAVRFELLGPAPDARFCVGEFEHLLIAPN